MRVVFIDESGYTPDWRSGIDAQPFYVGSAVCLPSDAIPHFYSSLRRGIDELNLPVKSPPLGLGFEIKAREIARGSGWWGEHNDQRNRVRDLFLSSPRRSEGVAFVASIDKCAHFAKYVEPADPYMLALTFVLERLEMYLWGVDDHACCVYDHNTRIGTQVQDHTAELIRDGSLLIYDSRIFKEFVTMRFRLPHILEVALGDCKYSIGLPVADYFATMAYHFYIQGSPVPCGWWDLPCQNLHQKEGTLQGIGLKEFP